MPQPALYQNLRFVTTGWAADTVTPPGLEVEFDGGAAGPEAASLAMAERTLPQAGALIHAGLTYLQYFILPSHFGAEGEWEPLGFVFGAAPRFAGAHFAIDYGMMQSDIYGLWSVAFLWHDFPGLGAQPFAFARVQS